MCTLLWLRFVMCKCVEGYIVYIHMYTYVGSPSRLGIQLLRRMLLYPVWIYFLTLGGEGTFVRVGVKTEFIASWLPLRMGTARKMGHREGPPSQRGRLLQQGKRKELPVQQLVDVEERRTEPGEDKASYLRKDSNTMRMELV